MGAHRSRHTSIAVPAAVAIMAFTALPADAAPPPRVPPNAPSERELDMHNRHQSLALSAIFPTGVCDDRPGEVRRPADL